MYQFSASYINWFKSCKHLSKIFGPIKNNSFKVWDIPPHNICVHNPLTTVTWGFKHFTRTASDHREKSVIIIRSMPWEIHWIRFKPNIVLTSHYQFQKYYSIQNIIIIRVSSPYTGHIPYSGQFRSTNFKSYFNVVMFCCLFVWVKDVKF